jgi:transformation/transcription domain-associated protein
MDQQLSLFLRDEVLTWYNIHQQSPQVDGTFRSQVTTMVEGVVQRAEALACSTNKEKVRITSGKIIPELTDKEIGQ